MKLTDWFPPEVKPVHVGWYEAVVSCDYASPYRFWWDGVNWLFHPEDQKCFYQNRYWRGIEK